MANLRKAALLRNICLWLIVAFVNKFTVNINQTQTICDCAASARSPLGCCGRSTLLDGGNRMFLSFCGDYMWFLF
jgi:hypothetical protein